MPNKKASEMSLELPSGEDSWEVNRKFIFAILTDLKKDMEYVRKQLAHIDRAVVTAESLQEIKNELTDLELKFDDFRLRYERESTTLGIRQSILWAGSISILTICITYLIRLLMVV